MSPLTKVFVILLVVCSLLTSAAVVVFVSKSSDTTTALKAAQASLASARSEKEAANADASGTRAQMAAAMDAAKKDLDAVNAQLAAANDKVNQLTVAAAKGSTDMATQTAQISQLTEALKAAQATVGVLHEELNTSRDTQNKLVKQTAELNTAFTDMTNKYDVVKHELDYTKEQLQATQEKGDKLSKAMKDHGYNPDDITANPQGVAAGAPPINGVIREKREINGVIYASISVGSADGVIKDMKFKVTDRETGEFYGYLTVDNVQPNDATGRLEGPKVAAIHAGNEAKTHL